MSHTLLTGQNEALKDLLVEINSLDKTHAASRTSRKVAHRLEPLIAFVERYSPAVDVGIQGISPPATAIWGCLRIIIIVSLSII